MLSWCMKCMYQVYLHILGFKKWGCMQANIRRLTYNQPSVFLAKPFFINHHILSAFGILFILYYTYLPTSKNVHFKAVLQEFVYIHIMYLNQSCTPAHQQAVPLSSASGIHEARNNWIWLCLVDSKVPGSRYT